MRNIRVEIDAVVLQGFEPADRKALVEGLQSELARVLGSTSGLRSHRTPVLRLGRMPLEPGFLGSRKLGAGVARAMGKGLKP